VHEFADQAGQEPTLVWVAPEVLTAVLHGDMAGRAGIFGREQTKDRSVALYTSPPAPANVIAVVQTTLEAAATECNRMMMFEGGRQESFAHHGVDAASNAIRAINPQSVIDWMSK